MAPYQHLIPLLAFAVLSTCPGSVVGKSRCAAPPDGASTTTPPTTCDVRVAASQAICSASNGAVRLGSGEFTTACGCWDLCHSRFPTELQLVDRFHNRCRCWSECSPDQRKLCDGMRAADECTIFGDDTYTDPASTPSTTSAASTTITPTRATVPFPGCETCLDIILYQPRCADILDAFGLDCTGCGCQWGSPDTTDSTTTMTSTDVSTTTAATTPAPTTTVLETPGIFCVPNAATATSQLGATPFTTACACHNFCLERFGSTVTTFDRKNERCRCWSGSCGVVTGQHRTCADPADCTVFQPDVDIGNCDRDCNEDVYWSTWFVDVGALGERVRGSCDHDPETNEVGAAVPVATTTWQNACMCYAFCAEFFALDEQFVFDRDHARCRCFVKADAVERAFCGLEEPCRTYTTTANRTWECDGLDECTDTTLSLLACA